MGKRTAIDFTRHKVKVTQHEGILIHEFKRPDTINCMLVFINTRGVMTVTGDFGNWVFCREFRPSTNSEGGVSDGYWDEKLQISSEQTSKKYDADVTRLALKEFRNTALDYFGRELNEEELDWLEELENNVDDEYEYTHIAYREKPNDIDYEYVPFGTKRHIWLDCVYDGFEALCEALKSELVEP